MNQNRLRWACRRGMLELDLVLNDFLEHQYSQLSSVRQKAFESLLSSPDPDLMNWLLKGDVSHKEEFSEIISLIKLHANRII